MKADDDTYVVMKNLRSLLYNRSADEPQYIGRRWRHPKTTADFHYAQGGAGYVLSRATLQLLVRMCVAVGSCVV